MDIPGLPGLEGEIGNGLHGEQEVVEQGEGTVTAVQHLAGGGIAECEQQDEQELLGERGGFCHHCSDEALCPWSIPCSPEGSVC